MPPQSPLRIKPPALRPGDKVGIVAPASYFKREEFDAGCAALRKLGYDPVYSDSIFERDLYFAGTAQRRARELQAMFDRDDIGAILCARGGYGANYLLPLLDMRELAARPKIIVGYSDITSLLTYCCDVARFVTFHGPMVAKDFNRDDGVDFSSWNSVLGGVLQFDFALETVVKPLIQGAAEGILYGGCLSMLVASLGTPYEARTNDTILFIEDVGAKPYQIDRMLMHLKLAGKFDSVRGLIFGEMLDCFPIGTQSYTLEEVIMRVVGDLRIPVAFGVRSGHVSKRNITLPLGVSVGLEVGESRVTLKILEAATAI